MHGGPKPTPQGGASPETVAGCAFVLAVLALFFSLTALVLVLVLT